MTLTSAIAVLLCAVKKVIKYVYTPANVDQVIATSITATFTMFNDSGHSCVPTVLFATAAWKKNKRFEVRGMLLELANYLVARSYYCCCLFLSLELKDFTHL